MSLEWGGKEKWNTGERAYFEYHCFESHSSSDAEAWYRSHQPVTILEEYDYGYREVGNHAMRADAGMPVAYRVRWDDGFEYDVMEDELLVDPKFYERPDPPSRRQAQVHTHEPVCDVLGVPVVDGDAVENVLTGEVGIVVDLHHGINEGLAVVQFADRAMTLREHEMRKTAQHFRDEDVNGYLVQIDNMGNYFRWVVYDATQNYLVEQGENPELGKAVEHAVSLAQGLPPKTAQSVQPQVGDILYTSWGYDQTNVEFFQVTRVLPASVEVRRIGKKYDETGFMSGNSVPVPDKFVSDFEFGDKALIRRFRAAPGLGYAVRIDDVRSAWLWDGKPKYESHYAKKKEAWLFIPIDEQVKLVLRVDGDIELKEVSRKSLPGYATQFGSVSPFIVTYDAVINGTKAIVSAKGFTETTSDLGAVDTIESAQVKQWLGFKVAQAVGECWYCMGTGECQYCGGIGYGTYTNDPFEEDHDCDDCNGSGLCHHCDGTGEDFEFDGEKKTAQLLWEDMRPGDRFVVRGKGNYLISDTGDEEGNRVIPLADGDMLSYMGLEDGFEYFKSADGREGAWWQSDTLGLGRTASAKIAYIREESGKYKVYSESGKLFGTYDTKAEAEKRLQQMHYFKSKEGQATPVLKPLTNESLRWKMNPRNDKPLRFYSVEVDGKVIGIVGQVSQPGHHKGVRPNSSTGRIVRWGYSESTNLDTAYIKSTDYGFDTRQQAVDALVRAYRSKVGKTAAMFEAYEDDGQRRTTDWTTEDEARKFYEQWAAEGGVVSIVRKEDNDINGETMKLLEYSEGGKRTVFPKTAQERTWGECLACGKEMRPNNMGCFPLAFKDDGTAVARITYGGNGEYVGGACPDCNCAPGTPHHDGCDQEVCPECHGQFAFCECGWTGLGGRLVQGQANINVGDIEVAADQWQEERDALDGFVCLECCGSGLDPYGEPGEGEKCLLCGGSGKTAQEAIEGDQIHYEQDPVDVLPEEDDVTGIL